MPYDASRRGIKPRSRMFRTLLHTQITSVTLYRLAIPMRRRVEHGAAARDVADPLVVRVDLADGHVGYGETLARPYVTGETIDSVIEVIRNTYVPALLSFRPAHFPEALELTDSLTLENESVSSRASGKWAGRKDSNAGT